MSAPRSVRGQKGTWSRAVKGGRLYRIQGSIVSPQLPRATTKAPANPALRGSVTIIPGPTPETRVMADDVAIKQAAVGVAFPGVANNPTVAAGDVTAAGIAALIADSGQLAAGVYRVEIVLSIAGVVAAGKRLSCEHRNAANSANIALLGQVGAADSMAIVLERVVLALNERIRVVVGAVAVAASEVAHASIRAYLLPG